MIFSRRSCNVCCRYCVQRAMQKGGVVAHPPRTRSCHQVCTGRCEPDSCQSHRGKERSSTVGQRKREARKSRKRWKGRKQEGSTRGCPTKPTVEKSYLSDIYCVMMKSLLLHLQNIKLQQKRKSAEVNVRIILESRALEQYVVQRLFQIE